MTSFSILMTKSNYWVFTNGSSDVDATNETHAPGGFHAAVITAVTLKKLNFNQLVKEFCIFNNWV